MIENYSFLLSNEYSLSYGRYNGRTPEISDAGGIAPNFLGDGAFSFHFGLFLAKFSFGYGYFMGGINCDF